MKKKKETHNEAIINKKKEADYNDDIVIENTDESVYADTIKKLRKKLKKCMEEKREYLDGWQRSKADFMNAKKKEEKLREELISFAKESLMLDLLSSIDNFDMAYADKNAWESVDKNWRIGIEYIHSQLLKTLGKHGLEQFDPIGEQFDPARHDSVELVVTDKKDDDHKVLEVMQKGYVLNGKVIRPAKVKVGKYG